MAATDLVSKSSVTSTPKRSTDTHFVVFSVNGTHLGVPASDVAMVLPDQAISVTLGAAPHVLGVIHDGRRALSVIDGRGVFATRQSIDALRPRQSARVIALRRFPVGLLVDEVHDVVELFATAVPALPVPHVSLVNAPFVIGCAMHNAESIPLLDLPALIAHRTSVRMASVPASVANIVERPPVPTARQGRLPVRPRSAPQPRN